MPRGRPSISGQPGDSPRLSVRVSHGLLEWLADEGAREDPPVTPSEVARRLLGEARNAATARGAERLMDELEAGGFRRRRRGNETS
jgi:hypothetical protein